MESISIKTDNIVKTDKKKAVLFFHGGSCIFTNAEMNHYYACKYADTFDAVVFSVDFRLAPETAAPKNI